MIVFMLKHPKNERARTGAILWGIIIVIVALFCCGAKLNYLSWRSYACLRLALGFGGRFFKPAVLFLVSPQHPRASQTQTKAHHHRLVRQWQSVFVCCTRQCFGLSLSVLYPWHVCAHAMVAFLAADSADFNPSDHVWLDDWLRHLGR